MFYQIFSEKKIFINMTIEEAKQILLDHGKSTCSCKYGGSSNLIAEAIKIKESLESKK
jgi:hypothetical protein